MLIVEAQGKRVYGNSLQKNKVYFFFKGRERGINKYAYIFIDYLLTGTQDTGNSSHLRVRWILSYLSLWRAEQGQDHGQKDHHSSTTRSPILPELLLRYIYVCVCVCVYVYIHMHAAFFKTPVKKKNHIRKHRKFQDRRGTRESNLNKGHGSKITGAWLQRHKANLKSTVFGGNHHWTGQHRSLSSTATPNRTSQWLKKDTGCQKSALHLLQKERQPPRANLRRKKAKKWGKV